MTRIASLLIALLSLSGCRGDPVPPQAKPTPVLLDSEGHSCAPLAAGASKATVLLFLMHDCPVANGTAPAIARLVNDFAPKGIRFYGIYATETEAEINTHRKDYSLPFPGLLDPKLELARLAGATCVPEAAVFSPAGELLYRGRIDDRAVRPGTTKPVPQQHDLRLALDAVIAGKQPEPKFTKAVGCYLTLE